MTAFIEAHFWKCIGAALLCVALVAAGKSWLDEHDARLLAEQTIKASDALLVNLQKQKDAADAAGKSAVAALQKAAAQVKTPAQAVAAMPTVTDVPLNLRAVPELPAVVQVDAMGLYKNLEKCKETETALASCQVQLSLAGKIQDTQKVEVDALKHPVGFWHRLKSNAEMIGITAAVAGVAGFAAHK